MNGERQTNADGCEQDALDNRTEYATAGVQTEQQRAEMIEGLSDEEKDIYCMENCGSSQQSGKKRLTTTAKCK